MRKLVLFIPLVLFIGLGILLWRGLSIDPTELPSARLNQPFPAFSLPALQNPQRTLTADDLKGKPLLVNVWATWCITCKEEHPFLDQLKSRGVTIVGLNYKDDAQKARSWLERYGNPYQEVIFDKQGTLGLDLGVYGAPETYLLDAKGVVRYRHVGALDEKSWQTLKKVMDDVSAGGTS